MMWCLQVTGLLAVAQAFAPGPIRWSGLPTKRFVLALGNSPSRAAVAPNAAVRPQKLTLSDLQSFGRIPSTANSYFTRQSDNTIRDATGLCVEASGHKYGDAVGVNRCSGSPAQLWNVFPWSQSPTKRIQLQGSNKCLDVHFEQKKDNLDGVQIQLGECDDSVSELWTFEEAMPLPTEAPALRRPRLSAITHSEIIFCVCAALVGLRLGLHLWRWLAVTRGNNSLLSQEDLGGVAMCAPLSSHQSITGVASTIPAVMALSIQDANAQTHELDLVPTVATGATSTGGAVKHGQALVAAAKELEVGLMRILRTEPDWNLFAEDVLLIDERGSTMDLWTLKLLLRYARKFTAKFGLREEIEMKSTVVDSDSPTVAFEGQGRMRGMGFNMPVPFKTQVSTACTVKYNSEGKVNEVQIDKWLFNKKRIFLPKLRATDGQEKMSFRDKACLWAWGSKALLPRWMSFSQ